MKLEVIIKRCGYSIVGENDREITGIAFAKDASSGQLALAKTDTEVINTEADVVLTKPVFVKTEKTLLFTYDLLETALVKVAKCLVEMGEREDYSVMPEYSCNGICYFAENVTIGEGTQIGQNAMIGRNVSIGRHCLIEPNAFIKDGTMIGDDVHIASGAVIGADSFYQYFDDSLKTFCGIGNVLIENGVFVGNHTVIQRGAWGETRIGAQSQIGNQVDIGHDSRVGKCCKIVSQTGIAGNVKIGNYVTIYGQTAISNDVEIGDKCQILGRSFVTKSISSGETVSGYYARNHREEMRTLGKIRKL